MACAVCHSGQLDNTIKWLVRLSCTATTLFFIQVEMAWVCILELMGSNRVFGLFPFFVGLATEKGNTIYKQDVHHTFDAPINRMLSFLLYLSQASYHKYGCLCALLPFPRVVMSGTFLTLWQSLAWQTFNQPRLPHKPNLTNKCGSSTTGALPGQQRGLFLVIAIGGSGTFA